MVVRMTPSFSRFPVHLSMFVLKTAVTFSGYTEAFHFTIISRFLMKGR